MRAYKVYIEAEDQAGNRVEFVEIAKYPNRPIDVSGAVRENEREDKAVRQVRERMPHLKNVRAKWSIHV